MRRIVAYGLTSLLLSAPAGAQSLPPEGGQGDESDIREGVDLLSEGAQRLLRGLMGEVEPRMRDLAEALNGFDFDGIGIDDLGAYHPPEVLPNGDIIIRRKDPLETDHPMDDEVEI